MQQQTPVIRILPLPRESVAGSGLIFSEQEARVSVRRLEKTGFGGRGENCHHARGPEKHWRDSSGFMMRSMPKPHILIWKDVEMIVKQEEENGIAHLPTRYTLC